MCLSCVRATLCRSRGGSDREWARRSRRRRNWLITNSFSRLSPQRSGLLEEGDFHPQDALGSKQLMEHIKVEAEEWESRDEAVASVCHDVLRVVRQWLLRERKEGRVIRQELGPRYADAVQEGLSCKRGSSARGNVGNDKQAGYPLAER